MVVTSRHIRVQKKKKKKKKWVQAETGCGGQRRILEHVPLRVASHI